LSTLLPSLGNLFSDTVQASNTGSFILSQTSLV
jgi:hypothetical protein